MDENIFENKKNPFRVPENYFESFEVRVPPRTNPVKKKKEGPGMLVSLVKPWMTLAAGIMLVALVYAQIPRWFSSGNLSSIDAAQNEDSILNSLALMIDEANLTDWITEEDSTLIPSLDSTWPTNITEDEMALLTLFE